MVDDTTEGVKDSLNACIHHNSLSFTICCSHWLSLALNYEICQSDSTSVPRRRCTSTDVCEQSDVVVQGVVTVDDTTEGVKDSLNACIHHNSLSFTISCSH